MSPEERSSRMLALVSGWRESGMTQARYAEANDVSVHKLKYWLSKHKRSIRSSGGFIEIKGVTGSQEIVLSYPSGVELRISSHTPISVIKSLVNL